MIFIVSIISEIVALVMMVVLFTVNSTLRTSKRIENKKFREICYLEVALCVASIFVDLCRMNRWFDAYDSVTLLYDIPNLITIVMAIEWLLFVDISVNQSMENAKRRYRYAYIALLIELAAVLESYILEKYIGSQPAMTNGMYAAVNVTVALRAAVPTVIVIIFVRRAHRLAKYSETELKQVYFLKLSFFAFPMLTGFLVGTFTDLNILPFAMAIAIVLSDYSLRLRYLYVDDETGFYKPEFVDFLIKYLQKKNDRQGSAIRFSVEVDALQASDIIAQCQPERSTVIRSSENEFVLLSELRETIGIEFLIDTVREALAEACPETSLSSEYFISENNEKPGDFLTKVFNRS